ncbi:hypothetical protein ABEY30_01040 [Bacillus pacificus]|uniref:hypothetical protein n=1 Tax=Bacillus pacificus TaxID=2026187 RepID=UPI003D24FEE2
MKAKVVKEAKDVVGKAVKIRFEIMPHIASLPIEHLVERQKWEIEKFWGLKKRYSLWMRKIMKRERKF